jgi:hypothetical protein
MPRPTETGLNPVRKKLADGTVRTYYYDRKTGKSLGTGREHLSRWPRLWSWPAGTWHDRRLVRDYRASSAWAKSR